jgi:hypothetical protein
MTDRITTGFSTQFSNKSSFGNSDRGNSRQNSQMAGKTEPAGMDDSLTIAQYQVGHGADFF